MRRTGSMVLMAVLALGACSDDSNVVKPDQAIAKDLPAFLDAVREATTAPREASAGDVTKAGDVKKAGDTSKPDTVAKPDGPATCGNLSCDCTIAKGSKVFKLFGQVKEVTSAFPDLKVRVVSSNGQLKVNKNTTFPTKCGDWQATTGAFPVFTYQIVTFGEDFTIQYDSTFPGINLGACPKCI